MKLLKCIVNKFVQFILNVMIVHQILLNLTASVMGVLNIEEKSLLKQFYITNVFTLNLNLDKLSVIWNSMLNFGLYIFRKLLLAFEEVKCHVVIVTILHWKRNVIHCYYNMLVEENRLGYEHAFKYIWACTQIFQTVQVCT